MIAFMMMIDDDEEEEYKEGLGFWTTERERERQERPVKDFLGEGVVNGPVLWF
jgi:hypothetical protein